MSLYCPDISKTHTFLHFHCYCNSLLFKRANLFISLSMLILWLPIDLEIKSKILNMVYKVLYVLTPAYISSFIPCAFPLYLSSLAMLVSSQYFNTSHSLSFKTLLSFLLLSISAPHLTMPIHLFWFHLNCSILGRRVGYSPFIYSHDAPFFYILTLLTCVLSAFSNSL